MSDAELAHKKDLLQKYCKGLEEIWKRLVDQGPETGDPLELFEPAILLCEKSIKGLLQ